MDEANWTVGDLAEMAGVTVRTLHHYDRIGLLHPMAWTASGYRLYEAPQLDRLHLIRLYASAGVPLPEIRRILDDPGFDRITALKHHRQRLAEQQRQTRALITNLDRLIRGETVSTDSMFDGTQPKEWEEEAKERWGQTDSWKISKRRTKKYTPADWKRIRGEQEDIEATLAALMAAGTPADGPEAMDAAEQARLHTDRWFYPCSHTAHAGLGKMYTDDPRFAAHYDKRSAGLSVYVRDAILANTARHQG